MYIMEDNNKTPETGAVLVVDDQATQRTKIEIGATRLGHQVTTVASAADAMSYLSEHSVDVILLDIVMPDIDGYAVLAWLKDQPLLKHIPVVVISAYDDQSEMVVKAIEMGAEDFLPKQFALPLLQARINASLRKKRNRDAEILLEQQIERLMRAGKLLEQGKYNPQQLHLRSIATGTTTMSILASVLSDMGQKVYDRERRLRHKVQTLKGFGLLLLSGILFGLDAPVAKWLSEYSSNSLGMAIWVSVVVVLLTIPWAIYKKDIPRFDIYLIGYFSLWGFCTCVLGDVLLLMASNHIQASVIIIIMVTEVLMVYAYSAMTKLESTNLKKLIGVALGFFGVVLVVVAQRSSGGSTNAFWAFVVLGVPFGYAVIDIMIATGRKIDTSPATTLGLASIAGILIMIPLAALNDGFVPLTLIPGFFEFGLLFWGVLTFLSMFVFVKLINGAGAVFASQTAYVQTIAGIGFSFILLKETLSIAIWVALGVIAVGMLLVEPKREPEEELSAEDLETLMNTVS